MARLKEKYEKEVIPKLEKEFGISNAMAVPRITRVVCNLGLGEAPRNNKLMDQAVDELMAITGQRPTVRKARRVVKVRREIWVPKVPPVKLRSCCPVRLPTPTCPEAF